MANKETSMPLTEVPISSMPLTDVSTSPTKKIERSITLFGTEIPVAPQESSSLASKETLMPLMDVTISPTKKRSPTSMMMLEELRMTVIDALIRLDNNPKEMSRFPASSRKADENLKTHCLFDVESSENPRKKLKDDARKIKTMRDLSNMERKGKKRTRVTMELDLNKPPYTFTKILTPSDIGSLSRLMLEKSDAQSHILNHLSAADQTTIEEGTGLKVKVYDHDTDTGHDLVLNRMVNSTRSYVLNGGWVKEFVKRRDLKEGHTIGLFWNSGDSRLHIGVLSPAPADQKNPN